MRAPCGVLLGSVSPKQIRDEKLALLLKEQHFPPYQPDINEVLWKGFLKKNMTAASVSFSVSLEEQCSPSKGLLKSANVANQIIRFAIKMPFRNLSQASGNNMHQ